MLRLTIWLACGVGIFIFGIWQGLGWAMSLLLGFIGLCSFAPGLDSAPPPPKSGKSNGNQVNGAG